MISSFPFSNGHVQTIFPVIFRPEPKVSYARERIATLDGDVLDLDWARVGSRRLVVVLHGLEGHSRRKYVLGMIRAANDLGWDGLAMNFRGCSGNMNLLPSLYHSGMTEDLHATVISALGSGNYSDVALVGFSMGGNMVLKYLGEQPERVPQAVSAAVALSVPCDLFGCAEVLSSPENRLYMEYFLRSLRAKIRLKHEAFPDIVDAEGVEEIRTFTQFDDRYTAPLHGFRDAVDYWTQSSSGQFLDTIRVPSLIINAANDPFLSPGCYPVAAAAKNRNIRLDIPETGGHVGFVSMNIENRYWSERRATGFIAGCWGV